jgi:polyketide biosynthesis enoyl-CoA hydratase PksI
MGATFIVPHKLGAALGAEMLFTAGSYHGGRLRERGIGIPVLPRAEVVPKALAMARELADKPLVALKMLKETLTAPVKQALPAVVEREMHMHEITFAQPGVRERISARFGQ